MNYRQSISAFFITVLSVVIGIAAAMAIFIFQNSDFEGVKIFYQMCVFGIVFSVEILGVLLGVLMVSVITFFALNANDSLETDMRLLVGIESFVIVVILALVAVCFRVSINMFLIVTGVLTIGQIIKYKRLEKIVESK